MTVDVNTLESFSGKKVTLTLKGEDGSAVQLTGKVEAASSSGIAFKESGKRDVDLVMPGDIEEIALAPEKAKKTTQKKLQLIEAKNVRQHLVDRHGVKRSEVDPLSDDDAFKMHEGIDHSDLGHVHVDKAAEEAAEAAKASESSDEG